MIFGRSVEHDRGLSPEFAKARMHLLALLPVLILSFVALHLDIAERRREVATYLENQAQLAASAIDVQLNSFLALTRFCANSPALRRHLDFATFTHECGRAAEGYGAWVVLVELGETHRQIVNTRTDAPAILPSYPRSNERPELLALEERTRQSGEPAISDVFIGRALDGPVVSAGQWMSLPFGRQVMLYVSISARDFSKLLEAQNPPADTVFGLVDPSRRIVARSVGIDSVMFTPAPSWLQDAMNKAEPGMRFDMPGPPAIGGKWDAAFHPLKSTPGWMAVVVRKAESRFSGLSFTSTYGLIVLAGVLLTGLAFWYNSKRLMLENRVILEQERSSAAERASQEKSRLLASFAHDMRNPLVSLIGGITLLHEGRRVKKDDVEVLKRSAEGTLQLVDDILELSFLGSGQFTLLPTPVDLRKMAEDIHYQFKRMAKRKNLAFSFCVAPCVPLAVEVDRLRLQQVLSNLVSNALKYTEAGHVTARISAEDQANGQMLLTFSVSDSGVGISPADQEKVFREFGRLDRPIEQREAGTGLGLAICSRILRAMGAQIEIQSVPTVGSQFSFTLQVRALEGLDTDDNTRPLEGKCVILAEDEAIIRKITAQQLRAAGATIIEASDGHGVLKLLKEVTPDLLLIDLQMPKLDGVETIRRIKQDMPHHSFAIFVLTSHLSGPQTAEARAVGADLVVTKPIQVLPVAAALRARAGEGGASAPPPVPPSQAAPETTLVDLDNFTLHLNLARQKVINDFIPEFEVSMRKDLEVIKSAVAQGDFGKVQETAHRAVGICIILGAPALILMLRKMEQAATERDGQALSNLVTEVDGMISQTVDAMRAIAGLNSAKSAASADA